MLSVWPLMLSSSRAVYMCRVPRDELATAFPSCSRPCEMDIMRNEVSYTHLCCWACGNYITPSTRARLSRNDANGIVGDAGTLLQGF